MASEYVGGDEWDAVMWVAISYPTVWDDGGCAGSIACDCSQNSDMRPSCKNEIGLWLDEAFNMPACRSNSNGVIAKMHTLHTSSRSTMPGGCPVTSVGRRAGGTAGVAEKAEGSPGHMRWSTGSVENGPQARRGYHLCAGHLAAGVGDHQTTNIGQRGGPRQRVWRPWLRPPLESTRSWAPDAASHLGRSGRVGGAWLGSGCGRAERSQKGCGQRPLPGMVHCRGWMEKWARSTAGPSTAAPGTNRRPFARCRDATARES
ncbi:hypothetical protein GGTG_01631 [Gaeumannomyces tritici R3-111a-1]|uniref:Uncharacterized protein n=1 Tax=Gaeumannomyces tritici (strain R3-111a-1) TaxID=644352 RepID=J3NK49_GAET3|nr:hypothetical protein GGTG_01631 [Gaeumannomyces tritici R3-111a-1]EJT81653.1 hypothetical protein GGTG_01631 [Gaeumannomyces tritici R3-111a-1]